MKPCPIHVVHAVAGQLLNTLFGRQGQQDAPPSETGLDSSEGNQGHAQDSTEGQQLAVADSQQPSSTGRENAGVPEESIPSQPGFEDQGMRHGSAAAERLPQESQFAQEQRVQSPPQDSADAEVDRESDGTVTETETALAAAQEAQGEASQAQQRALAEEHQTLQRLREDMQQASGLPAHTVLGVHCIARDMCHVVDALLCIDALSNCTLR